MNKKKKSKREPKSKKQKTKWDFSPCPFGGDCPHGGHGTKDFSGCPHKLELIGA